MNKDDIIRMAREAGVLSGYESELFQRFAALVAAAEREACAKVVEELPCECCWGEGAIEVAGDFAAAIRKRGGTHDRQRTT